jgi:alanyl-tRNA synthetase
MTASKESRAHSGEHVLFQSLSRVFRGMESVKVVIEQDKKSLFVRYDGDIDWSGVLEAEKIANRIVQENRRVVAAVGDREEMKRRYGSKLRGRWDLIRDETIRIVEVEDFDIVACKGEHVDRTGEIGFIAVKKFNALGRGDYEFQFEVGEEAWLHALEMKKVAMVMMETLGTRPDLAESTAKNLRIEVLTLRKSLREASKKALETLPYEEVKGVRVYSKVFEGFDRKDLMKRVADLKKGEKTVVILGDTSGSLIMGRSDDLEFNTVPLLEKGCSLLGGRCGGKSELASGGGFKSNNLDQAIELIKRELAKIL